MTQIISANTVWRAGSTIVLQDDIQLAHGATLTIEAGSVVVGNQHSIEVEGVLDVQGTSTEFVSIKEWNIGFLRADNASTPGEIKIDHANVDGGSFLNPTGYGGYGSFALTNNVFQNLSGYSYVWYPTSDSLITGNLFRNSGGFSVGTYDTAVTFKDNTFVDQTTDFAIESWANYQGLTSVVGNGFLSTDRTALATAAGYGDAGFVAKGNWFGTTNPQTIDGMILDRSDSLTRQDIVETPVLTAPSAGAPKNGTTGDDVLSGRAVQNFLFGEAGNDRITGGSFVDFLHGGSGNDLINGLAGNDTMIGGSGDDRIFVDNVADMVVEYAGEGNDRVLSTTSYALQAGVAVEVLSTTNSAGTGAINLTGNEFAQTIYGNAGNNRIVGGGGADTLSGFGGNDTYFVDNAGDKIVEGTSQGTADAVATSISYTLGTSAQIEIMRTTNAAGTATINLTGNGFAQTITGNAGANRIIGGGGADTMSGLGGNDTYYVDNAGDVVVEGSNGGTLDIVVTAVSYTLSSAAQVERFGTTNSAGTTAINLTGNAYAQAITGNAGINRIAGKGGLDTMTGLGGNDTFVFGAIADSAVGTTRDQIVDFDDAGNDVIDLSAYAGTLSFVGASAFTGLNQVRAVQSGTHVLIQINTASTLAADSEIMLLNTTLGSVDRSDFLL